MTWLVPLTENFAATPFSKDRRSVARRDLASFQSGKRAAHRVAIQITLGQHFRQDQQIISAPSIHVAMIACRGVTVLGVFLGVRQRFELTGYVIHKSATGNEHEFRVVEIDFDAIRNRVSYAFFVRRVTVKVRQ